MAKAAKQSREDMEAHMVEIFRPMDNAVESCRGSLGGFDQGYPMHEAARELAPPWLRAWDDKHRWCICFTQGWNGLVILAEAFGWTKEMLLDDLMYYESIGEQDGR